MHKPKTVFHVKILCSSKENIRVCPWVSLSAAVQMGSNLAVDFQAKITLTQTLK